MFRILVRLRQMLRTQAAAVQSQMKALHNMQSERAPFSVFSLLHLGSPCCRACVGFQSGCVGLQGTNLPPPPWGYAMSG